MSLAHHAKRINRTGHIIVDGIWHVEVEVEDIRQVFNRVDYFVKQVGFQRRAWVCSDRVTFLED